MQNYQSLRKLSITLRDMPEIPSFNAPNSSLPVRNGSLAGSHASADSSQLGVAGPAEAILADHRKDSVVSAHSMRSNHSGISPRHPTPTFQAQFRSVKSPL